MNPGYRKYMMLYKKGGFILSAYLLASGWMKGIP
jgi:hypothetical protein